ncbi:hypothetical protein A2U01_0001829 [Trifolium medium]|uniref:Uncharacterized protein n=1 Tax=Trifolium medium TaxID=97028 RepID=A0A392M196_9FABA|nr:hypothetical protein [Trifolium medium]
MADSNVGKRNMSLTTAVNKPNNEQIRVIVGSVFTNPANTNPVAIDQTLRRRTTTNKCEEHTRELQDRHRRKTTTTRKGVFKRPRDGDNTFTGGQ